MALQGRGNRGWPIHSPQYWCSSLVDSWGQSWWRRQMEIFSELLALCAGNSQWPVNSPHKGQWRRALMFSLICPWINGWVNNREAGDMRWHRVHYDVIVMINFWISYRAQQQVPCNKNYHIPSMKYNKIHHLCIYLQINLTTDWFIYLWKHKPLNTGIQLNYFFQHFGEHVLLQWW